MLPPKSNSNSRLPHRLVVRALAAVIVLVGLLIDTGFCAEVFSESARQVAQGVLRHHSGLFGHWNGSLAPSLGDGAPVQYDTETVAFNFQVRPSGHILVIVDDELSPVPLYSTTSVFIPGRAGDPNAIESWILPELRGRVRGVREIMRGATNSAAMATRSEVRSRIRQAWTYFKGLSPQTAASGAVRSLEAVDAGLVRGAALGPLLTTTWGQDTPYNLQAPDDACASGHTLTGCVATAWAQLLNYWRWPPQGQGSYSYAWTGDSRSDTLSADFGATNYAWADMPAALTGSSSQAQKDAVSLLIYHLGVAAEMDFGCSTSGSLAWADEILDTYFRYKSMSLAGNRLAREDFSAAQWFAMFKAELDADPPRPVIFTIGSDLGWHEVVVDGYQTGAASKVHINFGWEGSYDGYYDINDDSDFNTAPFNWYANNNQVMVVGIEPDNPAPIVDAGSDQSVEEETAVQLSGSATDPDPYSTPISSYLWTQVSGPGVSITNAGSTTATITTPNVHAATQLVFRLRADDANRAVGTDTVTITVNNTDGSVAPAPPAVSSSGGGSSGGCFIASLLCRQDRRH